MNYQEQQDKYCDLRKGDVVKVIRIPKSYELGWSDIVDPNFAMVGDSLEVTKVYNAGSLGVVVKSSKGVAALPYFCLELVKRKNPSVEEGQVWTSEMGTLYVVALTGYQDGKLYTLLGLRSQNRSSNEDVNITADVMERLLSDFSYKGMIKDFLKY